MKKKIIFHCVDNKTAINGMTRLAERAIELQFDVLLLISFNSFSSLIPFRYYKSNFIYRFIDFLIEKVYFFNISILEQTLKFWKSKLFQNRILLSKRILKQEKPDYVFTYGDRHITYELELIRSCKELCIPVIVPPIARNTGMNSFLNNISNNLILSRTNCVTNDIEFKRKYPYQWKHDVNSGKDLSFYAKWLTEVLHKNNLLPNNPWINGASSCDFVLLHNEIDKKNLINNGVVEEKIFVTGQFEYDFLFNSLKNNKEKFYEKYGLSGEKKIIIVALPQLYEHNLSTLQFHWDLQNFICETLESLNHDILLSLHPKMIIKEYKKLERFSNIKILDESLHNVLIFADLFIVGSGSTTLIWSILLGKPFIVMNWYGVVNDNTLIPSFHFVNSRKDFKTQVLNFLNPSYLSVYTKELSNLKFLFLPFDGKSLERIFNMKNYEL